MKGEMTIKATEFGVGIEMDLTDASPIDKFELLHSMAIGLQMSRDEMIMYCQLERIGVFTEAERVTHCEDDVQLDAMLQGKDPGSQKKTTAEEVLEELHKLMKKLGG